MKKIHNIRFTAILLLSVILLSSCATSGTEVTLPADTEALFPADEQPSVPDADDITYGETKVPVIYLTTRDGTQVTSKDEFSPCNVRFELNGIFEEY